MKKIALALALLTTASVASAHGWERDRVMDIVADIITMKIIIMVAVIIGWLQLSLVVSLDMN